MDKQPTILIVDDEVINLNILADAFKDQYHLISCDLSDINQFREVLEKVKIDYNQPTFLYSECVLSYIEPKPVDDLLKYIKDSFRINWIFDY